MKKIILSLTLLLLGIVGIIYVCNKKIEEEAKGLLYTETSDIPYNKVGLLLGTSKFLSNGTQNQYYFYRIDATLKLMAASKISYVIISGDNSTQDYNEPELMRADLIKGGVDSTHIFLDYAGFRTYDSMIRLKEIFSQNSVTVISQQFHNERAIYTGNRLGIATIGFNAQDVSAYFGFKTQVREKLARVKVFLDFMFGNQAKFLGNKIEIPS
ncbi:MAG: protein SanA [Bacteroidetes bacterium B1(2017)]|nr:MAG: protein SanA [Bacteroidetes bacterium B1(2017)]